MLAIAETPIQTHARPTFHVVVPLSSPAMTRHGADGGLIERYVWKRIAEHQAIADAQQSRVAPEKYPTFQVAAFQARYEGDTGPTAY